MGATRKWRIIGRSVAAGLLLIVAATVGTSRVEAQQTVGLLLHDERAYEGYTLWTPRFETIYLIDNAGKLVHTWQSDYRPGNTAYLLANGNLLRAAKDSGEVGQLEFVAGGWGGRVEELAWDGTVVWTWLYASDTFRLHHDIEPLPNGNVLMIAWELKTVEEAIQAGRDPALLESGKLWPEHIIEVESVGATGGNVVWEWHAWDHLVQDFDPTRDNFGVVADHPELIDVNVTRPGSSGADWIHMNAIDYNEALDQILVGSSFLSEIWVIDHGTTTKEARGHTGGRYGKGGDLLYRWGNPEAYGRGGPEDRKLFGQHHPHWIEPGLPGAGNILVFNNGGDRPDGSYSSVDEFVPPVGPDGSYALEPGAAYGPDGLVWRYTADPVTDLFSGGLSGAQRLPNGNTLVCQGRGQGGEANFFEITSAGETVWRYVNPVGNAGPIAQGDTAGTDHNVFRVLRYPASYPGFDGRTLTPGDPVEQFDAPLPPGGGVPLRGRRLTVQGDALEVSWDAVTCPASGYNLIFGNLADVATYGLQGSVCAIGTTGIYDWLDAPSDDLYFLLVGVDETGVYESSWGPDGSGTERHPNRPSNACAVAYKVASETCP